MENITMQGSPNLPENWPIDRKEGGADAIYLPGQDGGRRRRPRVFTTEPYHGLVYTSTAPRFDATTHFGCQLPSPGGAPAAGAFAAPSYRLCRHGAAPALQVPARLPGPAEVRQEGTGRRLCTSRCDARAPPVTLGGAALADVELREALYSRAAFWVLGVSQEVTSTSGTESAVGGLVAGWAVQRLISLAGGQVQVRYDEDSPGTPHQTAVHRYQNRAAQTIRQWTCAPGRKHLIQCVRDLFTHLAALQLLQRRLVDSLVPWWEALEAIGYVGPPMGLAALAPMGDCGADEVLFHPVPPRGEGPVAWSRYRPSPALPLANEQLTRATLHDTCSSSGRRHHSHQDRVTSNKPPPGRRQVAAPPVNLTHSWVQFESVMLVVIFNEDHYDVIPYIELLYRPFFPHMVYCGPGLPDFSAQPRLAPYRLSFLAYAQSPEGHARGAFNYECFLMASRLRVGVTGYLMVADDMYVSLTRLTELPLTQVWFLPRDEMRVGDVPTNRQCRLGSCDFFPHWRWWQDYREQTLAALRHLEARHRVARPYFQCHRQLLSLTGGAHRALAGYADIYFVPARLAADVGAVLELFLEHHVFLEIAIPTAIWCLELPDQVAPLHGLNVLDASRDSPQQHFNRKNYLGKTYLHPTKWSGLVNGSVALREFYCDRLLPHLHDPYGRMRKL